MSGVTASYARHEVGVIAGLGAVATAAVAYFLGLWAVLPAAVTLGLLSFYRDPERRPPAGENLVLAAADGKVVAIQRGVESADGGPVLRIMVFLSVLNVHINRSPCAGRVTEVSYRPGEFRNALRAAADTRNECNTITLEPAGPLPGPVRVRQIAGVLARRIVCTARVGDRLTAGQRLGMIKLGSRTEVCLAEDPRWQVQVRVGEQVRAGRTVLARLRPSSAT
jgi:phosphatidylserine decarboxylase